MTNRTHSASMTVGELSRRTGVSVKNLRRFTDDGLIYTVGRSPAGYRLFDADALWCVQFIGQLRDLGLTLAEIRRLLRGYATGEPFGPRLAAALQGSRERLHARIIETRHTLRRIDQFEARHRDHLTDDICDRFTGDPRCTVAAGPSPQGQALPSHRPAQSPWEAAHR